MTDEQILQNAEAYAKKIYPYTVGKAAATRDFIAGAHSRDEEIKELKEEIESLKENEKELFEGFKKRGTKLGELMKENNKLRNPWISVEERLPEEGQDVLICNWEGKITRKDHISKGDINYMNEHPEVYVSWMLIPKLKEE